MMCIIIYDGNTCYFAFVLETAVSACEASKSFDDHFFRKIQKMSQSDSSQGIGYIVDTRNFQIIAAHFYAVAQYTEGSVAVFVIGNVSSLVICIMLQTIGDDFTWKITDNIFIFRSRFPISEKKQMWSS